MAKRFRTMTRADRITAAVAQVKMRLRRGESLTMAQLTDRVHKIDPGLGRSKLPEEIVEMFGAFGFRRVR